MHGEILDDVQLAGPTSTARKKPGSMKHEQSQSPEPYRQSSTRNSMSTMERRREQKPGRRTEARQTRMAAWNVRLLGRYDVSMLRAATSLDEVAPDIWKKRGGGACPECRGPC